MPHDQIYGEQPCLKLMSGPAAWDFSHPGHIVVVSGTIAATKYS